MWPHSRIAALVCVLLLCAASGAALAQTSGNVTVMGDHMPHAGDSTELRIRGFLEQKLAPSDRTGGS